MERLLDLLSKTYYTLPIMFIVEVGAVIVSFSRRKKFSELKAFHFYPLGGLLQAVISIVGMICFDKPEGMRISESSINIFSLIEVLLIYYLASHTIKMQKLRIYMKFMFVIFCIYICYSWFYSELFFNSSKIIPIQSIAILLPTYLYFFQLFKLPPSYNLFDLPAFWINIGILFVFSCTLPLSALEFVDQKYIYSNFYFYYINFLSYTVLYLLIIRGYFCKIGNQKITDGQLRHAATYKGDKTQDGFEIGISR